MSKKMSKQKVELTDAEIQDYTIALQKCKKDLLLMLGKGPPSSLDEAKRNAKQLVESKRYKEIMEQLKFLPTQRLRLLGKLAFDVRDLHNEMQKERMKQKKEEIRLGYLMKGDKFLSDRAPVNPLLKMWYTRLTERHKEDPSRVRSKPIPTILKDKVAYNVRYRPICLSCMQNLGLLAEKNDIRCVANCVVASASLTFSTCHEGVICQIQLTSRCLLCQSQRPCEGETQDDVTISSDPFVDSLQEKAQIYLAASLDPKSFVKDIIWAWIDNYHFFNIK